MKITPFAPAVSGITQLIGLIRDIKKRKKEKDEEETAIEKIVRDKLIKPLKRKSNSCVVESSNKDVNWGKTTGVLVVRNTLENLSEGGRISNTDTLPKWRKEVAKKLDTVATIADVASLVIDATWAGITTYAAVDSAIAASTAGPEWIPVGGMLGLGTGEVLYQSTGSAAFSTGLDFVSFVCTSFSDMAAGNTYYDRKKKTFIIGKETKIDAAIFLSNLMVQEVYVSTAISAYDVARDYGVVSWP
jgi:hypothetical protein